VRSMQRLQGPVQPPVPSMVKERGDTRACGLTPMKIEREGGAHRPLELLLNPQAILILFIWEYHLAFAVGITVMLMCCRPEV
jgi:hypothetical protein